MDLWLHYCIMTAWLLHVSSYDFALTPVANLNLTLSRMSNPAMMYGEVPHGPFVFGKFSRDFAMNYALGLLGDMTNSMSAWSKWYIARFLKTPPSDLLCGKIVSWVSFSKCFSYRYSIFVFLPTEYAVMPRDWNCRTPLSAGIGMRSIIMITVTLRDN